MPQPARTAERTIPDAEAALEVPGPSLLERCGAAAVAVLALLFALAAGAAPAVFTVRVLSSSLGNLAGSFTPP